MDGQTAIVDQAQQRAKLRRTFVAAGAQQIAPPPAMPKLEDLPVLTEVVTEAPPARPTIMPAMEVIEVMARELIHEQLPMQRQLLAQELASWLDSELPQIVMRVLDGVTDQLVGQITEEARAALLPRLQAILETELLAPPAG